MRVIFIALSSFGSGIDANIDDFTDSINFTSLLFRPPIYQRQSIFLRFFPQS